DDDEKVHQCSFQSAYQGFEIIGTSGEELKNPERNIGRAIYISLGIVSIIYLAVALVATGLGPRPGFEESEAPMAELARARLGESGELILGLGALLATSSAFNAALFGSSRLAYAMAREGTMPRWFSSLSKTRRVPVFSLFAASLLIVAVAFLGVLKELAALASLIFLVIFFAVSLSNFRLRKETGSNALFPGLAMILCLYLILFVEQTVWLWFTLFLTFVLVTHELRRRITRKETSSSKSNQAVSQGL
ncbi:MAG: APC family permease, partial [Candidatus Geothermarchaeales archaeon]